MFPQASHAIGRPGFIALFLPLLLAGLIFQALPARAQEQSTANGRAAEVENIEKIVRDYLLRNPEVLVEALTLYEQRRVQAEEQQRRNAFAELRQELEYDPTSPVAGNPDGDVVIVEFFDYRCPYCRRSADSLEAAMKSDDNVRVVFKEFPILGPESLEGAKAALAAAKQGKYQDFHFALMRAPGDMSLAHLRKVAEQVGVDPDEMERDMQSDEIAATLRKNHALAEQLSIRGTPAFVIGGQLVPGAANRAEIERLIAQARANAG